MSSVEKEVRFKIDESMLQTIRKISEPKVEPQRQIDLTLGYDGFDSFAKFGYVCRVRQKNGEIWMEVKRKISENSQNEFEEEKVMLTDFSNGVNLFEKIGMKPYLYMNRNREIREYNGLKLFIDEVELLGTYIEIEYQDTSNGEERVKEFVETVGISNPPAPLYGDIFKNCLKEPDFKQEFDKKLSEFLSSY